MSKPHNLSAVASSEAKVPAKSNSGFRTEISMLRAVAVLIVLIYHLWPKQLSGGYVGVDVFFVISGFLITAHLLRELTKTGTVSLPQFWARRARRLLPAALTVIAATIVAIWIFAPGNYWNQWFKEAIASVFYVENWVLASDAVDYLAAENVASPFQHYWSLSVEEQFYLIWPILILALAFAAKLLKQTRFITFAIAALAIVSFAFSVFLTLESPASSYFITPTRIWEFSAGALLALLIPNGLAKRFPKLADVLLTVGLIFILGASFFYDGSTPFPGFAALLPVAGAALVILAGDSGNKFQIMSLGRSKFVHWLGEISYAIYLWHWPIIAVAQRVTGQLNLVEKVFALILTIILADLTTRFIENPVRNSTWLKSSKARTSLLLALLAMLITAAPAAGTLIAKQIQADSLQQELSQLVDSVTKQPPIPSNQNCFGPQFFENNRNCDLPNLSSPFLPSPSTIKELEEKSCSVRKGDTELLICEKTAESPELTFALVGDSHAEHFKEGLELLSEQSNWTMRTITKGSCHFNLADRLEGFAQECRTWNNNLHSYLAEHPEISTLFLSSSAKNQVQPQDGKTWQQTAIDGYLGTWEQLPENVKSLVILRDVPRMPLEILDCLSKDLEKAAESCKVPRSEYLLFDPLTEAAKQYQGRLQLTIVDLTDRFCDEEFCYPIIGKALAYRDSHHLSGLYSKLLAPSIRAELSKSGFLD